MSSEQPTMTVALEVSHDFLPQEYMVISSTTLLELVHLVNESLSQGWCAQGSICVAAAQNPMGARIVDFYQAMIRDKQSD